MNFMKNLNLFTPIGISPMETAIRFKRDEDESTISVDPSINGTTKGMVAGAIIGSKAGPEGAIVGAVIGGVAGCVLGDPD